MMGLLANASSLRKNDTLKDWIDTATMVVAREVFAEPGNTQDHAVRVKLATDVASNPSLVQDKFMVGIAGDPTLAGTGAAPPPLDAAAETVVLNKVRDLFTIVAKLYAGL